MPSQPKNTFINSNLLQYIATRNFIIFSILFSGFLFCSFYSFSQDAKDFFEAVMKFKEQKQFDSAIANLSQAILLKEKFEEAYIQRADCYTKFYNYRDAASDYQKLTSLFSKNEEYLKSAGKLFLKAGDPENASVYLEAYHKNRESDETIIPELVEAKNSSGHYADALQYCKKFEKIFALNPVFAFGKFTAKKGAELNSDYYPELLAGYKNMLASIEYQKNPARYHSYLFAYADALTQLKKYSEAIFLLRLLTNNESNNSKYFYNRSKIYYTQQIYDSALYEIQGAFKLSKANAQYFIQRAKIFEAQQKFKEACNDYEIAFENKADCEAVYGIFKCRKRDNTVFDAVDLIKKGIELNCTEENYALYLKEIDSVKASYKPETNKPTIIITQPYTIDRQIPISDSTDNVLLKGYVKDESKIKQLFINDLPVAMQNNFEFEIPLIANGGDSATITAVDIWSNGTSSLYHFVATVPDSITVIITQPALKNKLLPIPKNTSASVYITGQINFPKQKIKKILLNKSEALFDGSVNVIFEGGIEFNNTDSLTVTLISTFGAVKEFYFPIKRAAK